MKNAILSGENGISSASNVIKLMVADAAGMIKSSVATLSLWEKRSGHIRR